MLCDVCREGFCFGMKGRSPNALEFRLGKLSDEGRYANAPTRGFIFENAASPVIEPDRDRFGHASDY